MACSGVIFERNKLIMTLLDCLEAFLILSSIVFLLLPLMFLISQNCFVVATWMSGVAESLLGTKYMLL